MTLVMPREFWSASANYYATAIFRGRIHELVSGTASAQTRDVPLFLMRILGALVLDPSAYENVEADRHAAMQSVVVVMAVSVAGGIGAIGFGLVGIAGFVTGAIISLGAWLVWAATIATLGTTGLAEPQTRSNLPELLRVLGFAAAPGVFIALAAMPAVAPIVLVVVAAWMIAAAVIAVRQALDYRSTARAVVVCVAGAALSFGVVSAAALIFTKKVS